MYNRSKVHSELSGMFCTINVLSFFSQISFQLYLFLNDVLRSIFKTIRNSLIALFESYPPFRDVAKFIQFLLFVLEQ